MTTNPVLLVASNELSRIFKHPLVVVISCILLLLAILNGMASAYQLPNFSNEILAGKDPFLDVGISNLMYFTSLLLSVLSFSVGLLSIGEERSTGSIRVLLTKPLYRRDYIAGMFLGLSFFVVLVSALTVLLSASTILIFYGGPLSIEELVLRLISYIILLSLFCMEMLGIAMLIGALFKNLYQVLIIGVTILSFQWLFNLPFAIQNLIGDMQYLVPKYLYFSILYTNENIDLFDTSAQYTTWLSDSLPYIVFLIVLTIAIFLLLTLIFNNEES